MKNPWIRRAKNYVLLCCIFLAVLAKGVAEDAPGSRLEEDILDQNLISGGDNKGKSSFMSRINDGLRPLLRALEGVDTMLRSTRNLDVFQCLERLSCEMAAPLRNNGGFGNFGNNFGGVGGGGGGGGGGSALEVADEGHHIEDEGHVEEHDAAHPAPAAPQFLQPGFPPFGQFAQPGVQQVPQFAQPSYPYFPQQFAYPHYPYAPPAPYYPYPQYFQPQYYYPPPAHGQGHQAAAAPAAVSTEHDSHASQASHAPMHMMHAPSGHHGGGGSIKRSEEVHDEPSHDVHHVQAHTRAISPSFFQGYRERIQHRQQKRNWFRRMLGKPPRRRFGRDVSHVLENAKVLHRHRRGIMETLQRLWGGREFVGVLDRMMQGTDDSIYPYTRAALMGYTGSHETCEQLYPECPTTMDEVIDTFNNLRSHFPNGVPFRDRIPAPFRYLIP